MWHVRVNDQVSWIETYKTMGDVISQRTVWGTVIEVVEKPGNRAGFSIQGTYVRVLPIVGGNSVFLFVGHITSVIKAAA